MNAWLGLVCVGVPALVLSPQATPRQGAADVVRLTPLFSEESSWSPDSTRVVFDSNREGHTSLYVMDADGMHVHRLTSPDTSDETPAWSPDGRLIAFVSQAGGHNVVCVVGADGTNRRCLTDPQMEAIHPHWSPDSRRIIFCSEDAVFRPAGKPTEIYTIDVANGALTQVTRGGGVNTYPSYSPDGTRIAFRRIVDNDNSEVFVMNADGTNQRNLTSNPAFDGWPAWSPAGDRLVFGSNRSREYQIYVMNADGSGVERLAEVPGRCTSPKWSPDGTRITFDRAIERNLEILLVRAPGRRPLR